MTERGQLLQAFNTLLQPERFRDYGPNGLQVEGAAQITKIVSGVTASRALIEAAVSPVFFPQRRPLAAIRLSRFL